MKRITDKLEKLVNLIKINRPSSVDVFTIKLYSELISDIDALVYEIEGIPIKHIYSGDLIPYGVFAGGAGVTSTVTPNGKNVYTQMKNELEMAGDIPNNYDMHKDLNGNVVKIKSDYVKNINNLRQTLQMEGVLIDNKNKKIVGFKATNTYTIVADFTALVMLYGLTAEEITSVLYHELGHIYYSIARSYKFVGTVDNIMESFYEYRNDHNPEEAIFLTANALAPLPDNTPHKDISVAIVSLITKDVIDTIDSNSYYITDNEALADKYATEKGVGVRLATALYKLRGIYIKDFFATLDSISNIVLILNFLVFVLFGAPLEAMLIVPAAIMYTALIFFITSILGGDVQLFKSNGALYDKDIQRFNRIKHTMIKKLRRVDGPEAAKVIKEIEAIAYIMNKTTHAGSIDMFISNILPWNSKYHRYERFVNKIEESNANRLYLISEKMKGK